MGPIRPIRPIENTLSLVLERRSPETERPSCVIKLQITWEFQGLRRSEKRSILTYVSIFDPSVTQKLPVMRDFICGKPWYNHKQPPHRAPPRYGSAGCTWPYGPNATSNRS